jgi:DNA replication and repair protein RecF
MLLQRLELQQFRNYKARKFEFTENLNLVIGPNGSGKTNLIEAIQFFSLTRSIKTSVLHEVIRQGEDQAFLAAEFLHIHPYEVTIQIQPHGKTIQVNQKNVSRSSDLLEIFFTVQIQPDDIQIIRGTPQDRKNFLNLLLMKLDKEYFQDLKQFNHLLKQKRRLYKQPVAPNMQVLLSYQEALLPLHQRIVQNRKKSLYKLQEIMTRDLTSTLGKNLEIKYEESLSADFGVEEILKQEIKSRECLFGAHRDDFSFIFQEQSARKFMSLGEQRFLALLLKLSEIQLVREQKKIDPVVLLDDAFLGLDDQRKDLILQLLESPLQKIMTLTAEQTSLAPQNPKVTYLG